MIDHLSTYATDFEATRSFYEVTLATLGYSLQMQMVASWDEAWPERRLCAFGPDGTPVFWVVEVRQAYTPRHTAFTAKSHDEVRAFFSAALAAGGRDHGEPGPRPHYHAHYFAGFVLDPDGNNIEAVCHIHE